MRTNNPKTGQPLNDPQLRPEMSALSFAGVNTVGRTSIFCLLSAPALKKWLHSILVFSYLPVQMRSDTSQDRTGGARPAAAP